MGLSLQQSEKSSTIRLEGGIDIASAAEFKKLLLIAFESGKDIQLAFDGVTDLDVTAVELIWAARRAVEGAGVAFTLSGGVPESVTSTLCKAGLQQFLVPADTR